VAGYYYTDNVNALSHTAPYQYDSLNRLGSAPATGSVAYSQTFSYDKYGNMSCSASPRSSPSNNIANWTVFGATKGAPGGAWTGGIAGFVIGGPGGSVPGALLGMAQGAITGGMYGMYGGAVASIPCALAGAYGE